MKKLLFITSRNILENTGERNLIKNRAKVLEEEFFIKTEYIAYRLGITDKAKKNAISENIIYLKNPIQRFKLKKEIIKKINENSYEGIVVSGELVLWIIPFIKSHFRSMKIMVDIHGTIEELNEFKSSSLIRNLLKKVYYVVAKYNLKKYLKYSDRILVVSNSLKNHLLQREFVSKNFFFTIPCSLRASTINREEYSKNRNFYRNKYGIVKEEVVFVYSGGNSPWQCVEDAVNIYEKIKSKIGKSKMLILTGSNEIKRKYERKVSYVVDCVEPEEVTKVLCAGDFGFLLRKNYLTNKVAYPNKFLEYVESGLRIISTPYVEDIAKEIKKYNLGILLELNDKNNDILMLQNFVNNKIDIDLKKRRELLNQNSFKTTLKEVVKFLEENNE